MPVLPLTLFDPATGISASLPSFTGNARAYPCGFVLNGNPFVGFGTNHFGNSGNFKDIWEYNIASGSWTQRASWPGSDFLVGDYTSKGISTFSIGNAGYAVKGNLQEFCKFARF